MPLELAEESCSHLDTDDFHLRKRQTTIMIWALILVVLISTTPPIWSEELRNILWRRDSFGDPGSNGCVKLNFLEYLHKARLRSSSVENFLPYVGPHLPFLYRRYGLTEIENDPIDSNGTSNRTDAQRLKLVNDSDDRTDQLEEDLDRLLGKEKQNGIENMESDIHNGTNKMEENLPPAEPPLPSFNEWTKQKLEEQQQTDNSQKNGGGGIAVGSPTPDLATTSPEAENVGKVAQPDHHQHARNYASKECGAKILLANEQAQHASSVLNEKEPDEYMLNPCNVEHKFFVVELCETIQITRLDLANFELFSSSPKHFRVFVSERYPSTEWTFLGAWTAEDQRKIQHFPTEQRVYAKYVKVELLSHYGSEHFCPLSLFRVLGVSVVEEYEAEAAKEHHQQSQIGDSASATSSPSDVVQAINQTPVDSADSIDYDDFQFPHTNPASNSEPDSGKNYLRQELLHTAKDVVVTLAKGVIDKAQAVFSGSKIPENVTAPISNSTVNPTAQTDPGRRDCQWCPCLTCDIDTNSTSAVCGYIRALMVKRRPKPRQNQTGVVLVNSTVTNTMNSSESKDVENVELSVSESTVGDQKSAPSKSPVSSTYPTPPQDSSSLPGVSTSAKETVFARLNNRIRALEKNMSLSGEYLGELSLRYRKQMEEMQKAMNVSSSMINEHQRVTEEKLGQYRNEIEVLKAELESMKMRMKKENEERKLENGNGKQDEVVAVMVEKMEKEENGSKWEIWLVAIVGIEILALVIGVGVWCGYGGCSTGLNEEAVREIVENRVRLAIANELQRIKRNGIAVDVNRTMGNGHSPHGTGQTVRAISQVNNGDAPAEAVLHGELQLVENKMRKKAKRRQHQKRSAPMQKSTPAGGWTPECMEFGGSRCDASPAGILFSTSNSSSPPWIRVRPNGCKGGQQATPVQHWPRRNSCDALSEPMLAKQGSEWKFVSPNCFEVLAGSASSGNEGRSPEKRQRSGRGPS